MRSTRSPRSLCETTRTRRVRLQHQPARVVLLGLIDRLFEEVDHDRVEQTVDLDDIDETTLRVCGHPMCQASLRAGTQGEREEQNAESNKECGGGR